MQSYFMQESVFLCSFSGRNGFVASISIVSLVLPDSLD